MKRTTPKRHDAHYLRVSTIDQGTDSQEADLATYAARQDLPAIRYSDHFTGETMERPAFGELLAAVRAGRVRRVVVWRLDRLGRTASGLTALFAELQALGVPLVSLKDGLDLSTPAGRLMAHVLASVAQFEREVIRERIVAGIAAAKAQGKTWGGSQKGRRSRKVSEKAAAARLLRDQGESISQIGRVLGLARNTVLSLLRG